MITVDQAIALHAAPVLAVTIATLLVVVVSAFNTESVAERQWTVAYIAGLVCISVEMFVPRESFMTVWQAVSDATLIITVGSIWAGLRALNGRSARTWIPVLVAALVVTVLVSENSSTHGWFAYTATHAATATFLVLGAVEAAREPSGATLAGKLLSGFLGFCGLLEIARAIAGSVPGYTRVGSLSNDLTPLVAIAFVSFVTPLLLSLPNLVLKPDHWATVSLNETGVLPQETFIVVAEDRLRRAKKKNEDVVLLSCQIANLDEVALAFSPTIRDENLENIARIFMETVPTMAQVSYFRPHRFLILWVPQSDAAVQRVISQLRTAFVKQSVNSVFVLSATAHFEQFWARRYGYDLNRMIAAGDRKEEDTHTSAPPAASETAVLPPNDGPSSSTAVPPQ